MFSLRNYVKKGLINAIGKQPDFWVILNSANWLEKGVLLEEDLIEINQLIDEKNIPVEEVQIEEPIIEENSVDTIENTAEESEVAE